MAASGRGRRRAGQPRHGSPARGGPPERSYSTGSSGGRRADGARGQHQLRRQYAEAHRVRQRNGSVQSWPRGRWAASPRERRRRYAFGGRRGIRSAGPPTTFRRLAIDGATLPFPVKTRTSRRRLPAAARRPLDDRRGRLREAFRAATLDGYGPSWSAGCPGRVGVPSSAGRRRRGLAAILSAQRTHATLPQGPGGPGGVELKRIAFSAVRRAGTRQGRVQSCEVDAQAPGRRAKPSRTRTKRRNGDHGCEGKPAKAKARSAARSVTPRKRVEAGGAAPPRSACVGCRTGGPIETVIKSGEAASLDGMASCPRRDAHDGRGRRRQGEGGPAPLLDL